MLSALGETVLPILLVLGLGTRYAALGLLFMTGIIQLTVPDGWQTYHLPWAAMALAILTFGPGAELRPTMSSDWRAGRVRQDSG